MSSIRVVVSGTGKMWREVLTAISREPDLEPVGVLEKLSAEDFASLPDGSGLIPLDREPQTLFARCRPDVVVDFTNAEWAPSVARAALEAGARPVIGTTGLPDDFVRELEATCKSKGLGAVLAPNFAVGAVLMMQFAKEAVKHLPKAEIIEFHHEQKADKPSGTALKTAELMGKDVPIHSVRLPGLVAHQEVIFGGLGQTLTIRHDSISRESFMPGVLLAVRKVKGLKGLVYGLENLL